jgi:hypothetical protein
MHYFVVETKIMFSQYIYIRPAIHHLIPHSFIRKKRKKKIQAMILGKKVSHPKKRRIHNQSVCCCPALTKNLVITSGEKKNKSPKALSLIIAFHPRRGTVAEFECRPSTNPLFRLFTRKAIKQAET